MSKNWFLIFFILLASNIFGAELTFNSTDYAGSIFSFYTVPNFLSGINEVICEGTVGDDGAFKAEFTVDRTMPIYSEFGVYKGWFIADPGKSYEIILPPKAEKNSTNPYFRPKLVQFSVKNGSEDDTNFLVDNFNRVYSAEMSKNHEQIFLRRSLSTAEAVIESLQQRFETTQNEYFEQHKRYKYANLKYMALVLDPTPIGTEYFIEQPILYYHPEYSALFDKIYTKFLQYSIQQSSGQKTAIMINSGAYDQLIDWLTLDVGFDEALAESIILVGIKSLFYSKKFNSAGIFTILQKIKDGSQVDVHKETASKIYSELTRSMYGAVAPELALIDIQGNVVNWEDFHGKYVYVAFTRTDNEKFQYHKDLMKASYLKFKDDLALLVVIEDDDFEKQAGLLKADGFEWTICRGATRREIYQAFNVRIMPTYFLIDPNGRLAGSQAPWPDENFDIQFSVILNASRN